MMKRILIQSGLALMLSLSVAAPSAFGTDSRAHRAAMKVCKQKYKDAVKGIKYLKSRARRERLEQARRDRAECERLAAK